MGKYQTEKPLGRYESQAASRTNSSISIKIGSSNVRITVDTEENCLDVAGSQRDTQGHQGN